jgi:hypothetical protein
MTAQQWRQGCGVVGGTWKRGGCIARPQERGSYMTLVKLIAVALALAGSGFGIASAWFWWRSSRETIVLPYPPPIVTYAGPVIPARPMEDYMRRVSAHNAKAASDRSA